MLDNDLLYLVSNVAHLFVPYAHPGLCCPSGALHQNSYCRLPVRKPSGSSRAGPPPLKGRRCRRKNRTSAFSRPGKAARD
ncbi:hypothetical protein GWK89_09255 [Gluconobacter kondonii]|nr:hypothetical protein [Gluconobacter kondonii]